MTLVTVSEEALASGRATARSYLHQHPVQDEASKRALDCFLSSYEAVKFETRSHDAALYVAGQAARATLRAKPSARKFVYPTAPGAVLERVETTPAVLAAYFSFLSEAAEAVVAQAAVPQAVSLRERTYVLHKPIVEEQLVGLEAEQAALRKYTRLLFLYDPKRMVNVDAGRFPKTILLTGPPGTGKSSLIKGLFHEAKRLQRITGTPFRSELYDGSNFSSYFGKSTRILKQKLARVQSPSGVGVFCIEDVDMVLQSRGDSHAFHGVLELQQHLMNYLSGLTPHYGNTITMLTTNRPNDLDDALYSRMQAVLHVNPFTDAAVHDAYFAKQFAGIDSIGAVTHAAGFTGRDLESIAFLARERTTRAPNDDELRARSTDNRHETVTKEVLEEVIAAYTAARRTKA